MKAQALTLVGVLFSTMSAAGCGEANDATQPTSDSGPGDRDGGFAATSIGRTSGGGASSVGTGGRAGARTLDTTSSGGRTAQGTGVTEHADGGLVDAVAPDGGAGPCGFADPTEPNDTRDTPTSYALGDTVSGCVAMYTEWDEYEFTAPADVAGGYVQFSLTNVGAGQLNAYFYSASDNGEIAHSYTDSAGQSLNLYIAVASGQKYRLEVGSFSAFLGPFAYTLKGKYTEIVDTFEVNDTRDEAKTITRGAPIEAHLFAGYVDAAAPDGGDFSDWYNVALTTGTATAKLTNVPRDMRASVTFFDSGGNQLLNRYTDTLGADVTATLAVATPGNYFVRVGKFGLEETSSAGKGVAVPDHFTRKYVFTVSE